VIAEIAIGALLAMAGFGALAPVSGHVPGMARVWLSIPTGVAMYMIAALCLVLLTGTLSPLIALSVALGLGIVAMGIAARSQRLSPRDVRRVGIALGVVTLTVFVSRVVHLTRLSPDSLRYLLAATDLVRPNALEEMHTADLLIRQIGLPSLHSFYPNVDRDYLASIAPLFGVSGIGLFTWLTWQATSGSSRRRRLLMVGAAVTFVGTSNRLVYDSFYINTHIQMAVYLLIAVAGSWWAVSREKSGWAWPAGLALAGALLLRPEAPLVVAIILVTVAASRASWSVRAMVSIPPVFVTGIWYGIALWQNANSGDRVSLTAPVFGSLLAVSMAAMAVAVGGLRRARPVAAWFDRIGLGGIGLLLAVFAVNNRDVVADSIVATFRNLTYDGAWLLTWVGALGLLGVALTVHRVPDGRLWTVPIVGFGLLYWLLPLLREGAWRVGAGDSGNRILAHILAVVVVFLVLTAARPTEIPGRAEA